MRAKLHILKKKMPNFFAISANKAIFAAVS